MKTRFIINPIAGTGLQKNIKEEIKKYHKDFDVLETKKSGDAKEFSLDAVKKGFNQIIAVGGDGTVNECFPPLINTPIALGIIPCGSGNGFARYLGMDTNPAVAIKQLISCETKNIDTCSVNNMPFVNVSGVGFDAHIASLFSKLKKRGFINYIKLIFKELSYSCLLYTSDAADE